MGKRWPGAFIPGAQVDISNKLTLCYLALLIRPGVSLVTDKAERTVVSLIMAEAKLNDSGSYFCQPFSRNLTEDLPIANISVHVIKGANIDQLSGVDRPRTLSNFLLMITVSLIGIDLIKAAEKMFLVVREVQRKLPTRPDVGDL